MVRSREGETRTKMPEWLHANPFGGSQDSCLLQLRDGTLLRTRHSAKCNNLGVVTSPQAAARQPYSFTGIPRSAEA